MASTSLRNKRINLEILFWDFTILVITLIREVVRKMPTRLPFDRTRLISLLSWMAWILAGLSSGWLLGIVSK